MVKKKKFHGLVFLNLEALFLLPLIKKSTPHENAKIAPLQSHQKVRWNHELQSNVSRRRFEETRVPN